MRAALAVWLACCCSACLDSAARKPLAVGGVLDLSGYDLAKDGPVALDGEWELYWGVLAAPQELPGLHEKGQGAYLELPGGWQKGAADGRELEAQGLATLRLRILPGAAGGVKTAALRLHYVRQAYALWLNGRPLAASGAVSPTPEGETPAASLTLAEFPLSGEPVEVVLQVSNHSSWEGGVVTPVMLGEAGQMRALQMRFWAVAAFFAGSLAIMGIYHLALFAFRRGSVSPLYFGGYCLLWTGNFVCSESSDWVVRLLLPLAEADALERVALVCFFVSVPVGYRFFQSLYPKEFSGRLLTLASVVAAGFCGLGLAGPSQVLARALPWYYLTSAALIFYSLFMLHRARRLGREGADFILAGFFILGFVGINDMLNDMGIVRTASLIHVGMFAFIVFQSFALARLYSRTFAAVATLSAQLEDKNLALEAETAEHARLASEVVTVSEAERRRLSHDLHDGLCQQLTGARLRCSALMRKAQARPDFEADLAGLSALLEESTSQAYNLSRGLWPLEHDPQGAGTSLEELARRTGEATGVAVTFTRNLACATCVNEHAVHLYRIAQEAVANAVKHAKPLNVAIDLACDGLAGLTLAVTDDGVGRGCATGSQGGLGLRLMAHRARMAGAELVITDAPVRGTVVVCRLVCAAREEPTGLGV